MRSPVFLKLGGSLITNKTQAEAAQPEVMQRLAREVSEARRQAPDLPIVLGHGSGSFGHVAARHHGTRSGVQSSQAWLGFAQVADAAARLNRLVVQAFLAADVPVWSIQPSAGGWCGGGKIAHWQAEPFSMALSRGLIPLAYGDAMLDTVLGGTIASTEELFAWLVPYLQPTRIILAGTVDGVYHGDPLIDPAAQSWPLITPGDLPVLRSSLGGSHGVDVTGGMLSKVEAMCDLVARRPNLQVRILSGLRPGAVRDGLLGAGGAGGSLIRSL